MGREGLYERINNSLGWVQSHTDLLKESQIGTIWTGAIENYIDQTYETYAGIDFGLVVLCNMTNKESDRDI
jgi:hypothetical protein